MACAALWIRQVRCLSSFWNVKCWSDLGFLSSRKCRKLSFSSKFAFRLKQDLSHYYSLSVVTNQLILHL